MTCYQDGSFETFITLCRIEGVSGCSLFTSETIYKLHPPISKVKKECTVSCSSSGRLKTGGAQRGTRPFSKIRKKVLRAHSLFLTVFDIAGEMLGSRIEFLKGARKWMGRNMYKDCARWYAGGVLRPFIRETVSICRGIHRSEYVIHKESKYDEGAYAVK